MSQLTKGSSAEPPLSGDDKTFGKLVGVILILYLKIVTNGRGVRNDFTLHFHHPHLLSGRLFGVEWSLDFLFQVFNFLVEGEGAEERVEMGVAVLVSGTV